MEIDRAAVVLAALGGAARLRILELLADNPEGLGAGEIGRRLDVVQNTMSSQLKALLTAGVLDVRREGRGLVYTLVGSVLAEAAGMLDRFADRA